MKFEADADEPKAGLATGVSDHLDKAVKLDQIPEVIVHDNATDPNIEAISQHQHWGQNHPLQ